MYQVFIARYNILSVMVTKLKFVSCEMLTQIVIHLNFSFDIIHLYEDIIYYFQKR